MWTTMKNIEKKMVWDMKWKKSAVRLHVVDPKAINKPKPDELLELKQTVTDQVTNPIFTAKHRKRHRPHKIQQQIQNQNIRTRVDNTNVIIASKKGIYSMTVRCHAKYFVMDVVRPTSNPTIVLIVQKTLQPSW